MSELDTILRYWFFGVLPLLACAAAVITLVGRALRRFDDA